MLLADQQLNQERATLPDGDRQFTGIYLRADPGAIPPGTLGDGRNIRCRKGIAATRKGVAKLGWANKTQPNSPVIAPFGIIYGAGVFKDPGSVEWTLTAADGVVYRTRPGNPQTSIPLPTGVMILGKCKLVQAFNQVFAFRGKFLAPLRLTDLDIGFLDILPLWNSATAYAPDIGQASGQEVAYGPFQAVTTLTGAGTTVTCVTTNAHGYVSGADITVRGANQAEYNGRVNITVIDEKTFTYTFAGTSTPTATGTITVSNMAFYWHAKGSVLGFSISSNGKIATVTCNTFGLANGQSKTVAGATGADAVFYNGTFVIQNVTPTGFDYVMSGTPAAAAVGTLTITGLTNAAIAKAGTTATVTSTAHGFANGDTVTVTGAGGADAATYNGVFPIQNVTANTFDYIMNATPAAAATGAIGIRNGTQTLAGQSPDTNPEAWTQLFNVLPNAATAVYINNRLAVPTAYNTTTGLYDAKTDYVVATDFLDETHFDFVNQMRINQGGDDEIVDCIKFNDSGTLLVGKGKGIWALSGIQVLTGAASDLSNVSLTNVIPDYGLAAQDAWEVVGNDCYFVATSRGICSITQTVQNKLQGVDVPLSDPIQPLIDRIDWRSGAGMRVKWWDSKLYVATPLDDATVTGLNLIPAVADPSKPVILPLVIGRTYTFTPNNNAVLIPGRGSLGPSSSATFVATTTTATLFYLGLSIPGQPIVYNTAGVTLQAVYQGVNNTVLVYDFLNSAWQGRDTGSAITPQEFFKATLNGRERLFFAGSDGFLNLVEETDFGDQIQDPTQTSGLGAEEISTYMLTRGYTQESRIAQMYGIFTKQGTTFKKGRKLALILGTLRPMYSVNLVYAGVNERKAMRTNVTKDPTLYYQPWNALPWNTSNVNLDHATQYRQDYTVIPPVGGVFLDGGLTLDFLQETRESMKLTGHPDRFAQVELANTQGRIELRGVDLEAQMTERRKGVEA